MFPISRDPPEGGTSFISPTSRSVSSWFPISRDPPEGGTVVIGRYPKWTTWFPISRDPPEGGTLVEYVTTEGTLSQVSNF